MLSRQQQYELINVVVYQACVVAVPLYVASLVLHCKQVSKGCVVIYANVMIQYRASVCAIQYSETRVNRQSNCSTCSHSIILYTHSVPNTLNAQDALIN